MLIEQRSLIAYGNYISKDKDLISVISKLQYEYNYMRNKRVGLERQIQFENDKTQTLYTDVSQLTHETQELQADLN